MEFSVVISRDPDGNWLASVPVLPGCHTWGRTKKEVLENVEEAIQGCIESLKATGDPIPEEVEPAELIRVAVSESSI